MDSFIAYFGANAVWLLVLGGLVFFVSRFALKSGPLVYLLWVLVLLKVLLPPIFSVPLPYEFDEPSELPIQLVNESEPPLEVAETPMFSYPEPVIHEYQPEEQVVHEIAFTKPEFVPIEIVPPEIKGEIAQIPEPVSPVLVTEAKNLENRLGSILTVCELLWISGSIICLVVALWRIAGFKRILRYSEPIESDFWEDIDRLAVRMGLARGIEVRTIDANLPPLVWAFFRRPLVLLSDSIIQNLEREEILMLLAHEFAHIKRRDHLVRYIELSATILYWWHPMLWFARKELRKTEELCCDAWTGEMFPEKNREYGYALLHTLDILSENQPLRLPVTGSGMSMKETKRRIEMIIKSKIPTRVSLVFKLFVLALAAIVLPLSFGFEKKETVTNPLSGEFTTVETEPEQTEETETVKDVQPSELETFDLKVNCYDAEHPSQAVKDMTFVLCKFVQHYECVESQTFPNFRSIKGEILKISEQKNANSSLEFKNVPYPMDTRWFDQETGKKFDIVPKGQKSIYETYFITVKDNKAVTYDSAVNVERRFIPKKFDTRTEKEKNKQTVLKELPFFTNLRTVSGTILDSLGRPVDGACVCFPQSSELTMHIIFGTQPENGILENKSGVELPMVLSDVQGRYRLSVPWYRVLRRDPKDDSKNGYALDQVKLMVIRTDYNIMTVPLPLPDDSNAQNRPIVENITLLPESNAARRISRAPEPQEPAKTTWSISGRVIDAETKEPITGVSVEIRQKEYNIEIGEAVTVKTNDKGEYLFEKLASPKRIVQVTVLPFKRGGDTLVSKKIFPFNPVPSLQRRMEPANNRALVLKDLEHDFEMVKGNLLIGQLMETGTNKKLVTGGDGKPFNIALNTPGSFDTNENGRTSFNPLRITQTDKDGIFRFYVPEGVCYPCILDSGDDVIWSRTSNHEKWGKEGFLVQAGKLNVVTFYVKPREDAYSPKLEEPVEEEREFAERLALIGAEYELDSDKRITQVTIVAERNNGPYQRLGEITQTVEILKQLKHLKTVDLRYVSGNILGSEFKKLLKLNHLEEILVEGEGDDGWTNPKSLKGEEMKEYLESQPEQP